jgi:cell division protein ZapA (FtsZ GTPase activity inhibitor)
MSKEKTTSTAPVGVLAAIMAFLKLGEKGKLGSFFQRELKKLNSKVKAAVQTIANIEFNSGVELEKLRDNLEDAQDALDQSFLNVTPADVDSNAAQEAHSRVYWSGVEYAEAEVERITKQIDAAVESAEDDIKAQNDAIAVYEARIVSITG